MRRSEGAGSYYRVVLSREPGDGIYLRGFEHFLSRHVRQYSRQALAHHALARSRGADHEHIVSAGCCDLHGALNVLLTLDVGKIEIFHSRRVKLRRFYRLYAKLAAQMRDELGHILDRIHRNALGIGRLLRIIGRNEQLAYALACGGDRHGQSAVYVPERTV